MRNSNVMNSFKVSYRKIEGKIAPDRTRISCLTNLRTWFKKSSTQLLQKTAEKGESQNSHDDRPHPKRIRHRKKKNTWV
ncbi:hypothetical protein M8J77_020644 [Diaphorina citri]|nr:hypothetical protein M8J77_020644 [Diaphorina citri]